jgi:[ribosomal protein S5]-alanine N-acetyltransferase
MFETERLTIKILNGHELTAYTSDPVEFAKENSLHVFQTMLEPELIETINSCFLPFINDPGKEYIFYTLWLMIERTSQTIVGALCFHSEPENGLVEIGYGTNEAFRHKGFMTEALIGLLDWIKIRDDIDFVIAETDNDNFASIKTLEKAGFIKNEANESSSNFYYKLRP